MRLFLLLLLWSCLPGSLWAQPALRSMGQYSPSVVADFTKGSLPTGVSYSRTGTATRTNASGYVETLTANTPRFDYDPISHACKGLLVEETRTNLIQYSSQFTNAAWSIWETSLPTVSATAPDGSSTVTKYQEDGSNGTHQLYQNFSFSAATYTFSVYLKPVERNQVQIQVYDGNNGNAYPYFNLIGAGSVYNSAGADAVSITLVANGWYRLSVTKAMGNSSGYVSLYLNQNNNGGYQGDNASGLYVWGAQLEIGSFATSYIPTTSASVTRSIDVCNLTAGAWYNPTQSSVVAWAMPMTSAVNRGGISFNDGTPSNRVDLRLNNAYSVMSVGGSTASGLTTGTITPNALNKMGVSWQAGYHSLVINNSLTSGSPATIPTLTNFELGNLDSNGSNQQLNGWIAKVVYYPRRLANSFLQSQTN